MFTAHFEPEPESAKAVRRFVAETMPGALRLDDIMLVASELVSNVIRHARTEFEVQLSRENDRIRLEVSDGSSIIPAIDDLDESKHGLRMIEALAQQWGVEATETGKIVWVEFADR